ncbi:hypothetical protein BDR26DRAFT_866686 [Obelidium mucronatum]|nr:hypothetical protein BDR26DRAFT_866686 [Obelidium mucronatum]
MVSSTALALIALVSSVKGAKFCSPTQFTCTIQSDPFISPFSGPVFEFHSTGTFYAIHSQEMSLQVVTGEHYSQNLAKTVVVVDQIVYTCGSETQTFTTANVPASKQFVCKAGSCGSQPCLVTVGQGLDPVPNVQISQILYGGNQGLGGLCYNNDSSCPSSSSVVPNAPVPPAGNTPGVYNPQPPPVVVKTSAAIYIPEAPPVIVKTEVLPHVVTPTSAPKPTHAPTTLPQVYAPAPPPKVYEPLPPPPPPAATTVARSTPAVTPPAIKSTPAASTPISTPVAKPVYGAQGSGNIFQSAADVSPRYSLVFLSASVFVTLLLL